MGDALNVAQAVVFFIIFFIGIIGNAVVIFVLLRQRRTWSITTTYLFNLALADSIFICIIPFWGHYYLNSFQWSFGLGMCKITGAMTFINMYASIFFLIAMSMDRFMAVVHATRVSVFRTSAVARWVCVGIWCAALTLALPSFLYRTLRETSAITAPSKCSRATTIVNTSNEVMPSVGEITDATSQPLTTSADLLSTPLADRVIRCSFVIPKDGPNNADRKYLTMGFILFTRSMIGFVIPMVVICVCYVRIVMTVKKKVISRRVKKDRVAKLAALVIAAFFICWLPFHVMNLYSAVSGWWHFPSAESFNECFFNSIYPFTICLAYGNSCVNPIVYAFTTTNFQDNIKDMCASEKAARPYKMTLSNPANREEKAPKTQVVALHTPRTSPDNNNGPQYTQAVQVHALQEENVNGTAQNTLAPPSEGESFSYYSCPAVMQGLGKINSCCETPSGVIGAYSTPEKNEQDSFTSHCPYASPL